MSPSIWKTVVAVLGCIQFSNGWDLEWYNGTASNYVTFTAENASLLITDGYLNTSRPTVCHAHGLNGTPRTEGVNVIVGAYLNNTIYNVLALNWTNEANGGSNPIADLVNYAKVVENMKQVANEFGTVIYNLVQIGLLVSKLHLMGHSLGAHLAALAAKQTADLGSGQVNRVTALDPAKSEFDDPIPIYSGVKPDCALNVDVIHTDWKRYGILKTCGDTDTFVQQLEYNKNGVQPACPPLIPPSTPSTPPDTCSHICAVVLWVDFIIFGPELLASNATANNVTTFGPDNQRCFLEYCCDVTGSYPRTLVEAAVIPPQ